MSSFRETHIGIVTANDDPRKEGRIKVSCASLMGADSNGEPIEYPRWIPPRWGATFSSTGTEATGGTLWVPDQGSVVEFEITASSSYDQSRGQASITNPNPRWLGCIVGAGDALPDGFAKNYPKRRGVFSANGHSLLFDDSAPGTADGDLVQVNHRSGAKVTITADKVSIDTGDGESIELIKDGGVIRISSAVVEIDSPNVKLGSDAAEAVIKGTTFQALFNAHTHLGNLGAATGPPVVPLSGAELSKVVTTE